MENAPPPINPWLWVLVPVLFFTIFPLFWAFVVWLISHLSGWQRLAKVYKTPLQMNDPGESPKNGSLIVANYGKGRYVYTSLAFFRELPAGVPGAYRLFINLLSKPKN